jgi:hypothetical protein
MTPSVIEWIGIASVATAVPALAMAIWHGWKFEKITRLLTDEEEG